MKLYVQAVMGAVAAAVLCVSVGAYAQSYPSRRIHVIIPWPGGSNDAAGRLVFQKVSESTGQPVIIENRSGAAGTIGAAYVARSAPDGYIVMVTSATHIANAHLYSKLPFDTMKDFVGISPLARQVGVMAVHPSLPVKSVKDLIALAKARPGQLLYGSSGSGSFIHLTMAHLNSMTATKMVHVPYKGGDASGVALASGEIQALIATFPVLRPHMASNKVRVLAVTSDERIRQLPDTPTVAEAGVPGYEFTAWVGAFVPAGTNRAIVDRLSAEIRKALDHPDVASKFHNLAIDPMFMTPEQFAARLRSDYEKYEKVIAITGARVD
jgi:tripartite-type tricarboxylate transporter receptor subunit TctC